MIWTTRYFYYNDEIIRICDTKNGHIIAVYDNKIEEYKYNNNNESFIFKDKTILLKDCLLR